MSRLELFLVVAATVTMASAIIIPYQKVEAEIFSKAYGVQVSKDCPKASGGVYMGTIYPSGWLEYDGVIFSDGVTIVNGAESITIRVASLKTLGQGGQIQLRLDSITNPVFASIPIQTVGPTWCDFITVTTFLPTYVTDTHTLFFTFISTDGQPFVNIDWFQFNNVITPITTEDHNLDSSVGNLKYIPAYSSIQAEDYDSTSTGVNYFSCTPAPPFVATIADPSAACIIYKQVDFGNGGAEMIYMKLAGILPSAQAGTITFSLDSKFNPFFVQVPVQTVVAGGKCSFTLINSFLNSIPKGVHDVYVTLSSPADVEFVTIDWFTFNATGTLKG